MVLLFFTLYRTFFNSFDNNKFIFLSSVIPFTSLGVLSISFIYVFRVLIIDFVISDPEIFEYKVYLNYFENVGLIIFFLAFMLE